ncbi:TRAP transporter small permease [Halomonas sp. McH1-25]|uniref:TRAP transporter small permease n=1 Tax=unclassified Halomonas TaxID=2609666 RepID=UPI001EF40801|nr:MULTISPECIES: TRAP transporter small permease [unclassified Halomonas]MCG7602204.1 TRAP transporter small permease [Halomonas sp. McH1-25]MCP1344467.1 TRAP transporter small permease [Halomonas sp. FL8]MCP1362788.1 TRAP transporter small permease [Halomonas sp. BBD45]MCP1363709.1 TRAP transporter small permease [Halomonas sp. BBD48]
MRYLDWVDQCCRFLVAVGVLAMIMAIIIQISLRYFSGISIGGTSEIARFSFVWVTFLGSASAFRQRRHLSIDLIAGLLGPRSSKLLDTLLCALALLACYYLARYGMELTQRTWTQNSPTLELRMGYIYLAIPVSASLIAIYAACDIIRQGCELIRGKDTPGPNDSRKSKEVTE